jgi:hypothetical protein
MDEDDIVRPRFAVQRHVEIDAGEAFYLPGAAQALKKRPNANSRRYRVRAKIEYPHPSVSWRRPANQNRAPPRASVDANSTKVT